MRSFGGHKFYQLLTSLIKDVLRSNSQLEGVFNYPSDLLGGDVPRHHLTLTQTTFSTDFDFVFDKEHDYFY